MIGEIIRAALIILTLCIWSFLVGAYVEHQHAEEWLLMTVRCIDVLELQRATIRLQSVTIRLQSVVIEKQQIAIKAAR
jgi:hypothetical protein